MVKHFSNQVDSNSIYKKNLFINEIERSLKLAFGNMDHKNFMCFCSLLEQKVFDEEYSILNLRQNMQN